jgi:hypothetical protein
LYKDCHFFAFLLKGDAVSVDVGFVFDKLSANELIDFVTVCNIPLEYAAISSIWAALSMERGTGLPIVASLLFFPSAAWFARFTSSAS